MSSTRTAPSTPLWTSCSRSRRCSSTPWTGDIDLVRSRDPERGNKVLAKAVAAATATEQGRARLALAAAFGNIPGLVLRTPTAARHHRRPDPGPSGMAPRLDIFFAGPTERAADLERRAGGNPSTNRRHQPPPPTRPIRTDRTRAGSLPRRARPRPQHRPGPTRHHTADHPRPDRSRLHVPRRRPDRRTPVPVITLHTPSDGGAVSDHERWYAGQVRRHGDPDRLRQLYVDRGMHCAFNDAEEILTLRALFDRIHTGRWPNLNPHRLNPATAAFGDPYQHVLDLSTSQDKPMPPAFVPFTPSRFLRPSR